MKQLFLDVNSGNVKLIETPKPVCKDSYLIIETINTAVSAGTERSLTEFGGKNLMQKALARPDQVRKVTDKMSTDGILTTIDSAFKRLKEPMPMGYSGVGKVIECGKDTSKYKVGDIVVMAGQAYHSEINRVNVNLVSKVPSGFEDVKQLAFCALGGISLQGIHQAKIIPGETIGIIGMGLLGQILARILNAYGCDVIGYDIVNKSLEKSKLKAFINSNAENVEEKTHSLTNSNGVDKVIITAATNSNEPMDLAASIIRDRGTICMIGVTQMNIDRRKYYNKELTFTIARSYGPGRYDTNYEENGIDYPIGYVRFTEGRNLEEFVRLVTEKRLDLSDLVTHEIEFEKAEDAYEMITTNKENQKFVGILLKYSPSKCKYSNTIKHANKKTVSNLINIGLIGSGNFAKNTMLPNMKDTNLYNFVGVATTGGINIAQTQNAFNFDYSTNDYKKLISDKNIDLIVISTLHNTHSKFIIEALEADKHVYVEKPLCLLEKELNDIETCYQKSLGEIFVGFNRRYAPFINEIKNKLMTNKVPAIYDYIVNAGYIPDDHWTHDTNLGGGRIIGEAIHFIDLIQYLDGSQIESISVTYLSNDAYKMNDNAIIGIKLLSGAIGNITYTSMGSKKYSKEQLRVFANGCVYEMDNYIRLNKYTTLKKASLKLKQNKGVKEEYISMYKTIKQQEKNSEISNIIKTHKLLIKELNK